MDAAMARSSWTRPPGVPVRVPPHPGRFLERNCLRPLRLTQVDAARLLGMSRRRVHEIVQGQRGISADTAVRCALVFGIDTAFWLALQANWDSFRAWDQLRRADAMPRAPRPSLLPFSPR